MDATNRELEEDEIIDTQRRSPLMSTFKTHDGGDDAQIESGSGQLKAAGASGQGKVMGPSTSQ